MPRNAVINRRAVGPPEAWIKVLKDLQIQNPKTKPFESKRVWVKSYPHEKGRSQYDQSVHQFSEDDPCGFDPYNHLLATHMPLSPRSSNGLATT